MMIGYADPKYVSTYTVIVPDWVSDNWLPELLVKPGIYWERTGGRTSRAVVVPPGTVGGYYQGLSGTTPENIETERKRRLRLGLFITNDARAYNDTHGIPR